MKTYTTLKNWFPKAVLLTLVCGIIYVVAQQVYRLSANDPQYQMAEDAANALNNGADPKTLAGTNHVELSQSLAPYLVIYDKDLHVTATNASLYTKAPMLPKSLLQHFDLRGQAVTWQPYPGLRQATVLMAAKGNYIVVAGRSLRKTEERIAILGAQVIFGWAVSLIILLVVNWLQSRYFAKYA